MVERNIRDRETERRESEGEMGEREREKFI